MCFKGIDYYEFGENKTQKLGNSYKRQYGGKIEANYYYRAQSARLYDSYRHAKRRRKRLIMCGHSDGGSCSIIATLMILFSNYFKLNSVDIMYSYIMFYLLIYRCITFGAPYCVNKKIAKLCEELNFHHKFINFFNECLFIPVFHGSDDFYLTSTGGVITYYPRFLSDLNNLYEEMKSKHNNNNNKSNHHSHHHHYHSNNNKHSNKTIKKIKCPNKSILSASVEVINNKFVPLGKIYLCRGGRNHFLQEYILSIYAYVQQQQHDVYRIIFIFIYRKKIQPKL